jgi:hypothetical protein
MNCGKCHCCLDGVIVDGFPVSLTTMIVCPDCGNKRCPKASDHRLSCTSSNDLEQAGSVYSNINFRTLDE